MRTLPLIATAALALAAATPAWAHALLRAAEPAVGSTVAHAPAELKLTFSETVEPAFTRVDVVDSHGARVDAGSLQLDPADAKRVLVPLKPLIPGVYTVRWHATATDTHRTQGSFRFTVAP